MTSVERDRDCRDDDEDQRSNLFTEIVLALAHSKEAPFLPTSEPNTSVPGGGARGLRWNGAQCRAVFDVRGCGFHQAAICADEGSCWFASERRVFASDDADCAATPRCASHGECTAAAPNLPSDSRDLMAGHCVIASDAACAAATETCGLMGRCGLRGNHCEATTSEGCARSKWCQDLGRCTAEGGSCVADTEAECRASHECTARGRCYARDGICVSDAPVPLK